MVRSEVAVVVPAYNESSTIGEVVKVAAKYARVIVVDDCSQDGTGKVAEKNGAIVFSNLSNKGYEYSLNRGFAEAMRLSVVGIISMDADGEHDPADLAKYIDELVNKDKELILGVREKKQRFAELVMGWYVRLIYGPKDILCGFKGYSKSIVIANGGFDSSAAVGTELALKTIKQGKGFSEIKINIKPREDNPRFDNVLRANFRILNALVRLIKGDLQRLLSKK